MIQLTQQLDNGTLTQSHLDIVSMLKVKKINLNLQLSRLELEMQKEVKDWDKINFLNTDIEKMKNYIKNFNTFKN
jgi:hypothetical protein